MSQSHDPDGRPDRLGRPIFVGGMSRSGTTVVGKHLLNKHPTISVTRPAEMWFLTNTGGLCDLVDAADGSGGRVRVQLNAWRRRRLTAMAAFTDRMQGFWYRRDWWRDGRDMGLGKMIPPADLQAALDRFQTAFAVDPREAGRQLAADLIDPTTRARGKQRWVDTTPDNAYRVEALHRMWPDLRLINMIRDGRDVAASVVSKGWGTDRIATALDQWGRRMLAAHTAMTNVPPDSVLTVQLEELLGPHRERDYQRILDHLGIADAPRMRTFFNTEMTPAASHAGRWRQDLPPDLQATVDRRYTRWLDRLQRAGVQVPTDC